jgi:hypothetical protein
MELALSAPAVIDGSRKDGLGQQGADLSESRPGRAAQLLVDVDSDPTARFPEPQCTFADGRPRHLLKAQSLRTELQIGSITVSVAHLVLDGDEATVWFDFDHVGAPGESQRLRPQWHGPQYQPATFGSRPARIVNSTMSDRSPHGVDVLRPRVVNIDERTLARAVHVVLDGRDRDGFEVITHQRRSEA